MATFLMPTPRARSFTDAGVPAAGYLLHTYAAGTTTPKAAFTDAAGLVPHPNPIVLDAKGEAVIYYDGNYKLELKTPLGVTVTGYPVDNFETPLMSTSLAAANASTLIGNGGETVADSFNSLQLADYAAIRSYAGPRKSTIVTGYRAAASPSGIAGTFIRDDADTTSVDNGGTVIVATNGKRWKRQFDGAAYVEWFGAIGGAVVNDTAAIQLAINYAKSVNGVVGFQAKNYLVTPGALVVTGSFRSIKLQGSGTGNHNTTGNAGTCLVSSTTGNQAVIRAEFLLFANENFSIDGISFYNPLMDKSNGGYAIKLVRGATNDRYISGHSFTNIGAMGFGAAIGFQGMNTVQADNNYFGNVLIQNFGAQGCGIGLYIGNATLNLVTLSNTLFFNCPFGGIKCDRDGEVGAGLGKGAIFIGTLANKTHMEGVGGMFRTCATPTLNSIGQVVRSSITLIDFTHESCGGTIGPLSGEPYQLGINTDLHVLGYVVNGVPFGEILLGYLNPSARIWCDSRMRVVCAGGRVMTPRGVNAPIITASIPSGASVTMLVPLAEATAFGIKSHLLLSGGNGGYIESQHYGFSGGSKTNISTGTPGAGITLTWGGAADVNAINLTISNASGFLYTAELQVENMSSASITIDSSV